MKDTFRKEFRELSQDEKEHITYVKDLAGSLLRSYDAAIPPDEKSERSRCMNIARTNLEQSIMWAVKGMTG